MATLMVLGEGMGQWDLSPGPFPCRHGACPYCTVDGGGVYKGHSGFVLGFRAGFVHDKGQFVQVHFADLLGDFSNTFGSIYQNFDDAEKVRRTAGVEIVIVLSAGSWHTTRGRLENGIVDWRGVKGSGWVNLPLNKLSVLHDNRRRRVLWNTANLDRPD